MAQDPTEPGGDWTERKSGSRWVWIVPSLVLHVIIIGVWLWMPDKEPREADKKVHIKSEQVEQLKEHIEDANLEELHREIRHLQGIKQAMAEIRSKEMVGLNQFEDEMRVSMDSDANQTLLNLLPGQNALLEAQKDIRHDLERIEVLFQAIQPQLAKKEVSGFVPQARQVLEIRNALEAKVEELDRQFLLVQAKFDDAEAVFGWLRGSEVARKWDELVLTQERVFALQGSASDELARLQIDQSNALRRIVGGNGDLDQRIRHSIEQESKAKADYETQKNLHTENLKKAGEAIPEFELKGTKLAEQIAEHRNARKRLDDKRSALHGNSPEVRKKRREIDGKYKEWNQQFMRLSQQQKKSAIALQQARNLATRSQTRLKQTKPPSGRWKLEREKLTATVEQDLAALEGGSGDLATQADAVNLQEQAIEQTKVLMVALAKEREANP